MPILTLHTSTICTCSMFPALAGYMASGYRSNSVQVNQAFVSQPVAQGCFPWVQGADDCCLIAADIMK